MIRQYKIMVAINSYLNLVEMNRAPFAILFLDIRLTGYIKTNKLFEHFLMGKRSQSQYICIFIVQNTTHVSCKSRLNRYILFLWYEYSAQYNSNLHQITINFCVSYWHNYDLSDKMVKQIYHYVFRIAMMKYVLNAS